MLPTVDIIIVNWNAGDQLRNCIQSIQKAYKDGFEIGKVVIVDNNSSDGSMQQIPEIDVKIETVVNSENQGFSKACNQGANLCSSDFLLFLNPDASLFESSLEEPINFLQSEQADDVGIVGIQLVDDGVSRTCRRFPSPTRLIAEMVGLNRIFPSFGRVMDEWDHGASRKVDQVMGSFFLVRRSLFESLNGFDEDFFVYYEEVDFSLRAKQHGWHSYYLTDAKAFHEGGGTSRNVKGKRLFYSLRSKIIYSFKHFGSVSAIVVIILILTLELISRLLWAASRGSIPDIIHTIRGYSMLWNEILEIVASLSTPENE